MKKEQLEKNSIIEFEKALGICLFYLGSTQTLKFLEYLLRFKTTDEVYRTENQHQMFRLYFGPDNLNEFDFIVETYAGCLIILGYRKTVETVNKLRIYISNTKAPPAN